MLLDAAKSVLLLIDMQERLLPAMVGGPEVERRCGILIAAARQLDVPLIASEQYPRGLGHIVLGLRDAIGNAPVLRVCNQCIDRRLPLALRNFGGNAVVRNDAGIMLRE